MPDADPAVIQEIRQRLATHGRLTFAEVMEIALYHPQGGYYTAYVELGPAGDFVTSPEEHPAFGALLARQAAQCWEAMGAPAEFLVIEMGGGRGALAEAFLSHAQAALPEFAAVLRYLLIDRSPRLLAQQQERLASFGDHVQWAPSIPEQLTGLFLSNELVDAFPVHRVVMRGAELREWYVIDAGGELAWEEGPLSTPELAAYFEHLGIQLVDGQQAEVNLAAIGWMRDVGKALTQGFVITIDFGHIAKHLYHPERGSTLFAYRRQQVSEALLDNLGLQDLIAHVDFSTLVRTGKEVGLLPLGLVTQHHFLLNLGLEGWLASLNELPVDLSLRAVNRRALLALVETGENGLGEAKVLVQAKGVAAQLDGLQPPARQRNAMQLARTPMPHLQGL
ncbi:MAG: class I SAM-dependent methyltransferase [Armatimonadota bacterium]